MNENMKPDDIDRSVLISIDGSRVSMQALDYTLKMTRLIPGLHFVLLHVMPQIPDFMQNEAKRDGQVRTKMKKVEAVNREKGLEFLEIARRHLEKNNIEPERIETRIRNRHSGLAKDILNEAELGRFDALVVGRRGLTKTQELFMGSVSNQLVQHAANVPLWLNEGQAKDPKVLVAVDGSEASLRAVDHVAFMLGSNHEARVDFLHVVPKLQSFCAIDLNDQGKHWQGDQDLDGLEDEFRREDSICLDDFNQKAVRIMRNAGFDQERIGVLEREVAMGVARTIVKTAKEGKYGTLVLGRRGMGKSSFLGSISDKVIRRAEDMAIWLVN